MIKLFFILIFSNLVFQLFSQKEEITLTETSTTYTQKAGIYNDKSTNVKFNFYFNVGNGENQKLKYFGKNIRPYLSSSPEAIKDLNKFRNSKWVKLSSQFVFYPVALIYPITVYASARQVQVGDGQKTEYDYFRTDQAIMLGAGITSIILYWVYDARASKFIKSSVKNYNNSISKNSSQFFRKIKPDNYSVNINNYRNNCILGLTLKWEIK